MRYFYIVWMVVWLTSHISILYQFSLENYFFGSAFFIRAIHSFPKIYYIQALIQEIPYYILDTQYWIPITIFDSTNDFKLHYFKMIGKIRYESEFLTLIEDLVKLIIKSAIISLLSECLPKASTFVCSWSVSWYSDSQYLNVESQKTIF